MPDGGTVFTARTVVPIPHDACDRTPLNITWPTRRAEPLLQEAAKRGMALVKIHSHPGGYESLSVTDNRSDSSFFRSVCDLLDDGQPHASAVMLPGGRIFARAVTPAGEFQ